MSVYGGACVSAWVSVFCVFVCGGVRFGYDEVVIEGCESVLGHGVVGIDIRGYRKYNVDGVIACKGERDQLKCMV